MKIIPVTGQEIKDRLEEDPRVISDSIDILDDQVTFKLVDQDIDISDVWEGHEVMYNDCEDYEDEGSVVI